MPTDKRNFSFRLDEDTKKLVEALAKDTGLSEAAVITLSVRALAKIWGATGDQAIILRNLQEGK